MLKGSKCKRINSLGLLDWVTTNPTIISKENNGFVEVNRL